MRLVRLGMVLLCLIVTSLGASGVGRGASTHPAHEPQLPSKTRAAARFAATPMIFEQNQGQFDSRVKFLSRAPGYALFLTADEAVMCLTAPDHPSAVLRLKLLGAAPQSTLSGTDRQVTVTNYFVGRDPIRWRAGVPNFKRVKYASVYPGIDLVFYGSSQRSLEYDLIVNPGAKPEAITMQFSGARQINLDRDGNLLLGLDGGQVVQPRPAIYQSVGNQRQAIRGDYVVRGDRIAFRVAKYDHRRPLVIDPKLQFLTYLGGSGIDHINALAQDADRNIYVTGETSSADFPVTAGAFQPSIAGIHANAFVAKMNANATALLYATYLGGSASDSGLAIAVDADQNAYVGGRTSSPNFPVTSGAFQTTSGSTNFNGFVTKLNPTGTALVYSTYLGGTGDDRVMAIALDSSHNAYLAGSASSTNFPTTSGVVQPSPAGNGDAFVTELNAAGSALVYSTFLGGSSTDGVQAIALDSSNKAYLVGETSSTDFPVTAGVLQNKLNSSIGSNAFIAKLNANGTALVYSTYLGGSGLDVGNALSLDPTSLDVYVAGSTSSTDFPTTAGAFQTAIKGGVNKTSGFVAKISSDAAALIYSTILGGSLATDQANAIAANASGIAYVAGSAGSHDFPVTSDAFQKTETTTGMFFTELNAAGSKLVYSTFLSGNAADGATGIVLDSAQNAYIGGKTSSHDLPTTPGVLQPASGGMGDGFVVAFGAPSTPAKIKIAPAKLNFGKVLLGSSKTKTAKIRNVSSKKTGVSATVQTVSSTSAILFAPSSDCGALPPGGSCLATVVFTPTDTTVQNASLKVTDDATGSPQTIPMVGTGKAPKQ